MTAVQSTRDIGELVSSMMLVGFATIGYSGGFMLGAAIAFVALLVTFSHAQNRSMMIVKILARYVLRCSGVVSIK